MIFAGFDWDDGNRDKCRKHGVSAEEIEALFSGTLMLLPDHAHSATEERFRAIGRTKDGRSIFVVFAIRQQDGGTLIRPISARYMHRKEIRHYEEENPDLQE
ncbi:MAG: hypothetical protein CMM50_13130 [Rhodospirillaceae bacterium]|nr:hypothetical protein [Rhodospirillaceae bacterium]